MCAEGIRWGYRANAKSDKAVGKAAHPGLVILNEVKNDITKPGVSDTDFASAVHEPVAHPQG